ncbi:MULTISPECIES: signal peptidase II [unclassified Solwaraspora]|uniref:signal peptidase II n=1 Tax=unclassified Solwaraspora TaxID=2627926 RepID=UPI00259B183B|nr:signal peptidase II [Solwaraspora sp. WMMA2056]WJK42418.1 signal peptidase II [Solwaraspora sp. WMMA2056]
MSEQAGTDETIHEPTDGGTAARAPRQQRWTRRAPWLAFGIAATVLVVDQLTKMWAEATLTRGERTPLIGDALGIQLIYNPGAAFSMGENTTWVFTIAAAIGVGVTAWFAARARSRAWAVALGLVLGGAFTHLLDRLFREPSFGQGHVVDFIAYFDWFIGNVADIALFFGVVTFLTLELRGIRLRPDPAEKSAAAESSAGGGADGGDVRQGGPA